MSRRPRILAPALLALALGPNAPALPFVLPLHEGGALLEDVVEVLAERYYDDGFRERELPRLAEAFLPAARACESLDEERAVVRAFLAEIPVSHLALMSDAAFAAMRVELSAETAPTFGVQLAEVGGRLFATWIYEGGPAERAGVLRGDEVLTIDGVEAPRSPLLDWSTDDAALPDPPLHGLLAEAGAAVVLRLRRGPGEELNVRIEAGEYSGWEAAKASVKVFDVGGVRLGYVHLWHIPAEGPARIIGSLADGAFADCSGLVLDLRGRGGHATEVMRLLKALDPEDGPWRRPMVALTHGETRSAKEVIAYEIRERNIGLLVGERTAGAVIPATFAQVGQGATLMFPSFTLGRYTEAIEGHGVAPDVWASDPLPYSAGEDPILVAGIDALHKLCRGRLEEIDPGTPR